MSVIDDYVPVDVAQACNAGLSVLGASPSATIGETQFRGIPFQISTDPDRCFIAPEAPVRILIGRVASQVVFAHRQLAGPSVEADAVGAEVATYRFALCNGRIVESEIRQRYEISVVSNQRYVKAHSPFFAVPDRREERFARQCGSFDESGQRQREARRVPPRDYFLWNWVNPCPDLPIDWIELVPRRWPFLVAAITLANLAEDPFSYPPPRPLIVGIADDQESPEGMEVDVDRGVAGYPQPLAIDEMSPPGWGAVEAHGVYVDVAAAPSATVTISNQGAEQTGIAIRALEPGVAIRSGKLLLQLKKPQRNWIHTTVLDDDTNRPIPCRLRFSTPEGIPYQPHGHHNHVNSNLETWHVDVGGDVRLGAATYAYIDGHCQGWLPQGQVIAEITRGFEYVPLRQLININPGQRELTLRISRWTDMAREGWFSGDSHVHFLSTQGAHLEQMAEDVRVVNLLQSQWGSLFTNTEDFTGRVSMADGGRYVTYVGQENRQHMLGHLILWGVTDPVMPWCSDGLDEDLLGGSLEATLADWADRAHEQRDTTVVIPHFPYPHGEPAVLAATGRADAVESIHWLDEQRDVYYAYLNSGHALPLVGGTDKMSSSVPVGLYRTYARLHEPFSYAAWCRAVRAGRTFLSSGPMLSLTVDGNEIGSTISLPGSGTVHVAAIADGVFPLEKIEIVMGGDVVGSLDGGSSVTRLELNQDVLVPRDTWIAARCTGIGRHRDERRRPIVAHTSPVYIALNGAWAARDDEAALLMLKVIEGAAAYARRRGQSAAVPGTVHHHGRDDHLEYLRGSFNEALASLRHRYPNL